MADNTLLIEIEAKAAGAVKTIEGVNKSLNTVPAAANNSGASMDKLNKATGSAIPTLTNFGRVVQDAPFGLVGIANNIDPLLSSFSALKASTGSAGGAFKALAGSLLGPAGIAIGVSAVTSLLIAFGDKLFSSSKQAEALNKSLTDAAGTASKELVDFASLVGFAQDHTKSLSERKKAVDALQKEYPSYLKNVSDEALLTGQATEAINKNIESILRRATIKLLKDEIAASVEATAKQIISMQKAMAAGEAKAIADQKAAEKQKQLTAATKDFNDAALKALQTGRGLGELNAQIAESRQIAAGEQANRPEDAIKRLKEQLFQSIAPLLKLTEGVGDLDEGLEKVGKTAKVAKESITALWQPTNVPTIEAFDPFIEKIRQIQAVADKFAASAAKKDMEQLFKFVNEPLQASPNITKAHKNPIIEQFERDNAILMGKQKERENMLKQHAANLSSIIQGSVGNAISSLAQGLGNIIAGTGDVFGNFFKVIAAGMKQFGEALIAFGVGAIAIKKLADSPALSIAAGAALVVLSTVIESKIPKFAEGGVVNGPTLAMVGDNPGRKEAIIPIEKWDMLNNGGGAVVLDTRISGSDLILVQRRAEAAFRRTNG